MEVPILFKAGYNVFGGVSDEYIMGVSVIQDRNHQTLNYLTPVQYRLENVI